MKLNKQIFRNFEKKNINLITVDGITCSGKSLFADLLKKNLKSNTKVTNIKIKFNLVIFIRK